MPARPQPPHAGALAGDDATPLDARQPRQPLRSWTDVSWHAPQPARAAAGSLASLAHARQPAVSTGAPVRDTKHSLQPVEARAGSPPSSTHWKHFPDASKSYERPPPLPPPPPPLSPPPPPLLLVPAGSKHIAQPRPGPKSPTHAAHAARRRGSARPAHAAHASTAPERAPYARGRRRQAKQSGGDLAARHAAQVAFVRPAGQPGTGAFGLNPDTQPSAAAPAAG